MVKQIEHDPAFFVVRKMFVAIEAHGLQFDRVNRAPQYRSNQSQRILARFRRRRTQRVDKFVAEAIHYVPIAYAELLLRPPRPPAVKPPPR